MIMVVKFILWLSIAPSHACEIFCVYGMCGLLHTCIPYRQKGLCAISLCSVYCRIRSAWLAWGVTMVHINKLYPRIFYFQCLMYLYHHPDAWYDYATWHAKNGSTDSAIKIFQRAVKALPGNWISFEVLLIKSVMIWTSVVSASFWKLVSIWFTRRLWACSQECGKTPGKASWRF